MEAEPVFELEESATPLAAGGDVFGAPAELSFDEPQDPYLPAEPAPAPVAPATPGFDWSASAPEPLQAWSAPPPELEPEPMPWAPQPEVAPAAAPVAAPAGTTNGGGLSDEDVDRIARRVVELLGDKPVRDVAWEVIPDMCEVIIRDRLRELEAQIE